MMKALLALVIQLSLTYPHIPEKAQMNNDQASYLVSIHLIFSFKIDGAQKICEGQFFQDYLSFMDNLLRSGYA